MYIYKDMYKCKIIFDSERHLIICVIMSMAHYEKTPAINNPFVIDPDEMIGKVGNYQQSGIYVIQQCTKT